MRLVIASHVVHYDFGGKLYAYGPYAREIDLWADLFREIRIASPCRVEPPPGDCVPFEHTNIAMVPQLERGGPGIGNKLRLVLSLPRIVAGLSRAMRDADAIHVRCPGNIGLVAALLAPLFSRRLVAKYAGNWGGIPGEPISSPIQRALLRSRWWKGPVTVYGTWPGNPPHIVPFFTSLLTAEDMDRARESCRRERSGPRLRVLYTGRLSTAKNVDVLIRAIARVREAGHDVSAAIVGTGPEASGLQELARSLGLDGRVQFPGGLPFERVMDYLAESDVLVLASNSEGWPKSLAEGMAFGLACIGSRVGIVPQMLGDGRGFAVPPRDEAALVSALMTIADSPDRCRDVRLRAASWAQSFSLEGLQAAIRDLLSRWWGDAVLQVPSHECSVSGPSLLETPPGPVGGFRMDCE